LTVNASVHCHICPLKDTCKFGQPDASWRWHHQGEQRGNGVVYPKEDDYPKLTQATGSCPLRRTIAFVDTKMSQEILRSIKKNLDPFAINR
jgi:hypothetical protein